MCMHVWKSLGELIICIRLYFSFRGTSPNSCKINVRVTILFCISMEAPIESEMPLMLAVQPSIVYPPSKFLFTCFRWLDSVGLFRTEKFKFLRLIAAGTHEGAIMLLGDKDNKLHKISLMCGHSSPITDISTTLISDSFVSISSDGTLCGWNILDSSCQFRYTNSCCYGQNNISLCPQSRTLIWVWSLGICATLIDITNGSLIQTILFPGLSSFVEMSPHSSYLIKEETIILVGIDQIVCQKRLYEEYEKSSEVHLTFNKDEQFFALQKGLLKSNKNKWEILKPDSFQVVLKGEFEDMDEFDRILNIIWAHSNFFIAGTCSGLFYIVNLKRTSINVLCPYSISSIMRICSPNKTMLQSFDISNKYDIIFSSNLQDIVCLGHESVLVLEESQEEHLANLVADQQNLIVATDDSTKIYVMEWENELSDLELTTTTDKKITALFSRYYGVHKLQIIVGFEDGTLQFYSHEFDVKVTALSCPIVAIVQPNLKLAGRPSLIAIGSDGSFCFLKWISVHMTFETCNFQIISLYFVPEINLFITLTENGQFFVYSLDHSSPIGVVDRPSDNAQKLWSYGLTTTFYSPSSIVVLEMPRSTLFYRVFDISQMVQLTDNENAKEAAKNLCRIMTQENSSTSFVLLGKKQIPTFFYPDYRISGSNIFDTSPFVGAIHCISYHLLAQYLGISITEALNVTLSDKYSDFLPIFLQLIFADNQKIQQISAIICMKMLNLVPLIKSQELVSSYIHLEDITETSLSVKLLMSYVVSTYHNSIPTEFLPPLFDFLVKLSKNSSYPSILALSILSNGFVVWSQCVDKEKLYKKIVKGIVIQEDLELLHSIFFQIAYAEMQECLNSFKYLIENYSKKIEMKLEPSYQLEPVLKLFTEMAQKNIKICGSYITLTLNEVSCNVPQIAKQLETIVCSHADMFPSVKYDEFCLIGTPNGFIHLYKNRKLIFSEEILGFMTAVSIGPTKKYGAAYSKDDQKLKVFVFYLSSFLGIGRAKSHVIHEEVLTSTPFNYDFEWTDEKTCILRSKDINI